MERISKRNILKLPILLLIVHVLYQVKKHGYIYAWRKSVLRKGSWTSDFQHFLSMLQRTKLHNEFPTKEEKEKREFIIKERNINARYVKKTKEKHPPEMKKNLRDLAQAQKQLKSH